MSTPKTKYLKGFPTELYEGTFCGNPLSHFPSHSVYSESRGQRNLLYIESKLSGYAPPRQTCCTHQVQTLVTKLQESRNQSA